MKLIAATLISVTTLLAAPAAMANLELAKKSNCMACHKTDGKLVGPSYQDVAAKYKADKDAVKKLSAKVKAGGSGVWGPVPMAPNPNVADKDIETLVKWVLAGAK